jgi:hypothetical protein
VSNKEDFNLTLYVGAIIRLATISNNIASHPEKFYTQEKLVEIIKEQCDDMQQLLDLLKHQLSLIEFEQEVSQDVEITL